MRDRVAQKAIRDLRRVASSDTDQAERVQDWFESMPYGAANDYAPFVFANEAYLFPIHLIGPTKVRAISLTFRNIAVGDLRIAVSLYRARPSLLGRELAPSPSPFQADLFAPVGIIDETTLSGTVPGAFYDLLLPKEELFTPEQNMWLGLQCGIAGGVRTVGAWASNSGYPNFGPNTGFKIRPGFNVGRWPATIAVDTREDPKPTPYFVLRSQRGLRMYGDGRQT